MTRWMTVRLMANSLGLIDSCSQLRATRMTISPCASRSMRKPRSAARQADDRIHDQLQHFVEIEGGIDRLGGAGQGQQFAAFLFHCHHFLADLEEFVLDAGEVLQRGRRQAGARTLERTAQEAGHFAEGHDLFIDWRAGSRFS